MVNIAEQSGKDWQFPIFGCFGDFKICIISFLCPCYAIGKNAEALGEDCLLTGLLSCLGFPFPLVIRWRLRQQKGIKGSMLMDHLMWMFCGCCALAQESREVGWAFDLKELTGGGAGGGGSAPAKTEEMTRE